MGLRREKLIFEELWHVRTGKDHQDSRPKKWSKILKIVQTILARVLEVCLPVSDMGAKGWHWLCISYVNQS